MEQQRMIDREKVEKWFDTKIQKSYEKAEQEAHRKCYVSANAWKSEENYYRRTKCEFLSADIYAYQQPEPKFHWEDITADNLPKYYGQEVEVIKDDDNFGHAILRGYRPDKERPVITDAIDLVIYWEKARVKVYDTEG